MCKWASKLTTEENKLEFFEMGNSGSSEQDAVKKQAEGGSVPMYELVDVKGKNKKYVIVDSQLHILLLTNINTTIIKSI